MKYFCMILLALALASFACAKAITIKEADVRSGTDTEEKQHDLLKGGDEPAQNDKSDEMHNVQFADGKLGGHNQI